MEWLTFAVTIFIVILGVRYVFWRKLNKLEELGILHKKPLPILGNMAGAFFQRCHFIDIVDDVYNLNKDAEYVGFYDLSEPVIMIRSPELIKSMTVKNFDHFVDHRAFVDPDLDPLFGKNLLGLRGEKWREVRNLLSPAFTGSKMKAMFKLMSNCARNFVDCLAEISLEKGTTFDTKDAFTRYTNDVIATCAFGISVDSMRNPTNDFYVMGRDVANMSGIRALKMLFSRCFPMMAKLLNMKFVGAKAEHFFENVVKETIETRDKEGITRPDMIQLMMETRGRKEGQGPELTIQDMTAQAFIFFFGGFESTSTLMCFLAHEIAADPDVQAKLREEVDATLRTSKGDSTYEAINGMPYLDAVINETLRLYAIAAFLDRLCVKPFELPPALPGGKPITIQPGQNVWFPAFSMQRDSKYFPEPMKFDPERFMGDDKSRIDPFTYFPFGQGPRMCIGNRFALLETKVLIFHMLAKFRLRPSPKMCKPLKFSNTSFAMLPQGGFWLELDPREPVIGE